MNWSIGETSVLAIKAARGVGMPWGLAEEAGFALRWLSQNSAPGVSALCRYLSFHKTALEEDIPPAVWPDSQSWHCPLHLGAAISDGVIDLPVTVPGVREPLLLLPFLATRATDGWLVSLEMGPTRVMVASDRFASNIADTNLLIDQASCRITFKDGALPASGRQTNSRIPTTVTECLAVLTRFAHHTYAPATEESRLVGAGAGLNDND
ncbi:DUF3726 domain-containing protein [Candidatus Spongiihabitans sp.]|uniref:DUF3726 domain-containing protein n=1 Tax=Candidatus Spongiihabitans sp. TaxID=3101308 RepID=UPI003C7002B6